MKSEKFSVAPLFLRIFFNGSCFILPRYLSYPMQKLFNDLKLENANYNYVERWTA